MIWTYFVPNLLPIWPRSYGLLILFWKKVLNVVVNQQTTDLERLVLRCFLVVVLQLVNILVIYCTVVLHYKLSKSVLNVWLLLFLYLGILLKSSLQLSSFENIGGIIVCSLTWNGDKCYSFLTCWEWWSFYSFIDMLCRVNMLFVPGYLNWFVM